MTSPVTFALYIDDLLRELNKTSQTFALADDLVCICKGDFQLFQTVNTLNRICRDLKLTINTKKSAILILKHRNSKRPKDPKSILGFPVLRSYKYLGVKIDDVLNLESEHQYKQQVQKSIQKKYWITRGIRSSRVVQNSKQWVRKNPNDVKLLLANWENWLIPRRSQGWINILLWYLLVGITIVLT